MTSLMAAMMVIGPIIGGAPFELHDGYSFFFAGALMIVSLVVSVHYRQ